MITNNLLSAKHMCVDRDGKRIVNNVSFTIQSGQVLSILGPNGAGKSTLLKSVLGIIPATSGTVSCEGKNLLQLRAEERAKRVAYVPQRTALQAALSVEEVVAMGRFAHIGGRMRLRKIDLNNIDEALEQTDTIHLKHRPFATLSGGEQSRVLMSRALASEAPVILLDEPTASLDVIHAMDCLNCLRRLAKAGKGIGIVLHDLNQARDWTDYAIILNQGKGVECGPVQEVITNQYVSPVWGIHLAADSAFGYQRLDRTGQYA